ncbi:MAG: dicarboxylate/amino acid:cation symporter [Alphaproteobacteria bacterium]|nr:dicarboxylate/amino acid:cation symporter [Alphaproteobacteria bacterium]
MLAKLSSFKIPILLSLILLFSLMFGHIVPAQAKSFIYSLSLILKETLIFFLPFLIFAFLFSSMCQLQKGALKFALFLIPLICLSNFTSAMVAYGVGNVALGNNHLLSAVAHTSETSLEPIWTIIFPKLISNDYALLFGILFGIAFAFFAPQQAQRLSEKLLGITSFILKRLFIPVMPIFILGFSLKLQHEQILATICKDYLFVFILIASAAYGYIFFLYGFFNSFKGKAWFTSIQNMIPALVSGFSTMSSAASMPFTILGSEKNISRPEIARAVIPATANNHLVGDCFAIPIFALAILVSFNSSLPSYSDYCIFAFYFVLAKFAVAGVPGGGVLVMLPVLEQHLGFSPMMLSLITTLYIIFDPLITSANVAGNGAFAMFFSKVYGTISKETAVIE